MADLKALAERGERLTNEHDLGGLLEMYSDTATVEAPGGMRSRGEPEVRRFIEGWLKAFPDFRVRTLNRIISGDTVVEEVAVSGTHNGIFATPMGDIPPTGRRFELAGVGIHVFEGEKINRQRFSFDRMELMEQLGLIPTPTAAGASSQR